MTLDQQRIRIAKACGWKNITLDRVPWKHQYEKFLVGDNPNNTVSRSLVPDYLNDLNACHEMEKTLAPTQDERECCTGKWTEYGSNLASVCGYDPHDRALFSWEVYHATAAQRCEAFLKTIGKWETT